MPFYEYECSACGHHLEAMQKISDGPLRKCPECGRSALKRLMSAPAFRLKGGGWYETDFKSDADKKRNLAVEKDEAPKAEAGDKPAEKPAATAAKADPSDKPSTRTSVPAKRPAAARARTSPRKPATRKASAKARGGRR